MKTSHLLAGCVLAALTAGSAMAADLARPAPAPAPVYKAPAPLTYNWTGIYIGGDGGYAWGKSSGTASLGTPATTGSYNFDVQGPIAGGFIGGNYQFNMLVVGLEGDWQWADVNANNTIVPGFAVAPPLGGMVSSKVSNYGSLRGRLGVAFDRVLLFGTGGWAWGDRQSVYTTPAGATFTNSGNTTDGWAAGAGVEYAFTDWVIGRVEYRYTSLGSSSFSDLVTGIAESGNKIQISDIRAGLEVKVGPGPVVAAY